MAYPLQYPRDYWTSFTGLRNIISKKGFEWASSIHFSPKIKLKNPPKRHNPQIAAHQDDIHLGMENIGPAMEALQGFFAMAKPTKVKAHQM